MADRKTKVRVPAAVPAAAAPAPEGVEAAAPALASLPVPAAVVEEAPIASINEGTNEMTNETIDRVQETQKAVADRFQAAFGDANERAKGAVEKSVRFVEEITELTKGNVEALVASSKVAARGAEQIGQDVADYGRRSFEDASAALKSFAEVRSPTDFFKLQSDYARSAFDSLVAESAKVSETVLKIAGDAAEPLTSRYAVAAERVKTFAA